MLAKLDAECLSGVGDRLAVPVGQDERKGKLSPFLA